MADDPLAERGPAFEDDYLLVRAAIASQGLALDRPWPTEFAYYAVTSPEAIKRQPIRDFINWLKEDAVRDARIAG
ncbi:hypothetical protein [Agrobacterium sp. V1]|uniref:hypothetical protein n=1 Tax=Agrobacterium sp. V1 TaxID=3061957 RepID=UPI0026726A6B|nr:hypothetical protein [Agrobacterium sp. V1]MDO3445503.1 hypothetical protein [Agrobacterium sp. V1]